MDSEQIQVLALRCLRNPALIANYIRSYYYTFMNRYHTNRVTEYGNFKAELDDVLKYISGQEFVQVQGPVDNEQLAAYYKEIYALGVDAPKNMGGGAGTNLVYSLYYVCRLLKPSVVVETGVSWGVSSAFILRALEENGEGHLYSIDLPAPRRKAEQYIGISVPEHLRKRWTLFKGFSEQLLPGVLKEHNPDVFISDSAHNYQTQKMEYNLAYRFLNPNGALIADDVHSNDAFIEFSEKFGLKLHTMLRHQGNGKSGYFGVIRKK